MSFKVQQELEQRFLMPTYARKKVEFVQGCGMKLTDSDGREYRDFIGGIGACSLGHCHPAVVSAISQQAKKLIHVSNYYYIQQRGQLAELISHLLNDDLSYSDLQENMQEEQSNWGAYKNKPASMASHCDASHCDASDGKASDGKASDGKASGYEAPDSKATDCLASDSKTSAHDVSTSKAPDWKTFFANSGAEANECAFKLARLFARKQWFAQGGVAQQSPRIIVVLENSFHGRTMETLAATAQEVKQELFKPLSDGFITTPPNNVPALERLFQEHKGTICGFVLEPIQGESGVHPCSAEFMEAARRLTKQNNALLICDEVQCGIYRTGKYPFTFQHYGIVPDIVSMAKGIGAGVPCGATSAQAEIAEAFEPGSHGSTFGGSNIAVAAMFATLQELSGNHYAQHVTRVGNYFQQRLISCNLFKQVRGMGLMIAADLKDTVSAQAAHVVDSALHAGFVLNSTGPRTLRFLPPLVCVESDIDALMDQLPHIVDLACNTKS